MSDERALVPELDIALRVLRGHGDIFAEELFRGISESETPSEAFSATRLLIWPGSDNNELTPAQDRYSAIADEICERTFAEARQVMSEAFVRIAAEVLARERTR